MNKLDTHDVIALLSEIALATAHDARGRFAGSGGGGHNVANRLAKTHTKRADDASKAAERENPSKQSGRNAHHRAAEAHEHARKLNEKIGQSEQARRHGEKRDYHRERS
jgi:hypothetical protein